jgi:hypothetical protein
VADAPLDQYPVASPPDRGCLARFVKPEGAAVIAQIVRGTVRVESAEAACTDSEGTEQIMIQTQAARNALRPDILGQVVAAHCGARCTVISYFTSENYVLHTTRTRDRIDEIDPFANERLILARQTNDIPEGSGWISSWSAANG